MLTCRSRGHGCSALQPAPGALKASSSHKVARPAHGADVPVQCRAVNAVSAGYRPEEELHVPDRLQNLDEEAQPSAEEQRSDAASRECAVALAKVAWDTKAEDISVLHVAPLVYWCSYMVVMTIKSRPQLQAVLAKIEKEAAEKWDRRISQDASTGRSSWEVLDFMDVVVHVFTQEQREFYDLEAFYGAAEEVELPFLADSQPNSLWSRSM